MPRYTRSWPVLFPAILILSSPLFAQAPNLADDNKRILDYAKQNSEVMNNLEYLSDMIGPRLTGSARLKKANDWTAAKMKEYGLDNVHLEKWTVPLGWERGTCEARIIEPNGIPLTCASWAWVPGTKGKFTGPVVLFNPVKDEDYKKYEGKLKNAIVLFSAPAKPNHHPSRVAPGQRRGMFGTDEADETDAQRQAADKRTAFLKKEGVAVTLVDAGKPQMLLNMSGSWGAKPEETMKGLPRVVLANEHYSMLYRLLQRNVPVTVQVEVKNKFVKGPIDVYNTVGEIRGSEKPDEVVLCGAHLDSWDLGTGSTDNGTGSMVVLEAARLIKAMGLKPKRTIRFVLFSGEEEGLFGSKAYVDAHKDDMDKISAVFVHDTGTGKITGIGLHGNPQAQAVFESEIPALKELEITTFSQFIMNGTDHASFYPKGVPAFWFMQDSADYGLMHHSQSDTFDKALPDDLIQGASVMAICAYDVAQRDSMFPRREMKTAETAKP
jgi:carboxypeptidase Q